MAESHPFRIVREMDGAPGRWRRDCDSSSGMSLNSGWGAETSGMGWPGTWSRQEPVG